MTRPASAILHEADMSSIQRDDGTSTTRTVTPSCGAAAVMSGVTDRSPAGAPHRSIDPPATGTRRLFRAYGLVSAARPLVETGAAGSILSERHAR